MAPLHTKVKMPRLQLIEHHVVPRTGQALHNKLACGHFDQPIQFLGECFGHLAGKRSGQSGGTLATTARRAHLQALSSIGTVK